MKKTALAVSLLITASGICIARGVKNAAPTSAVLVELFTSEGCSSCPPADGLLQKLDSLQPVPGAQLVVLSEHVDYWNHDGWKDPFSSAEFTERQSVYNHALRVPEAYTPEFIVDGQTVMTTSDGGHVMSVLQKAAAQAKAGIQIQDLGVAANDPGVLHARIQAVSDSKTQKGDVYVALALSRAESQVLHGENGGRKLSHVAVLQNLDKVGKLESNGSFQKDCELKLNRGMDLANLRVIAFVQDSGSHKIVAVTLAKPQANGRVQSGD